MPRMPFLTWRRRFIILFVNAGVLAAFLGVGYLLDQGLGTWPLFFIIGFVLSFPVSLAALIRLMKKEMEAGEPKSSVEKL
jgi:F0F1-type ATP synthase assembly protein I